MRLGAVAFIVVGLGAGALVAQPRPLDIPDIGLSLFQDSLIYARWTPAPQSGGQIVDFYEIRLSGSFYDPIAEDNVTEPMGEAMTQDTTAIIRPPPGWRTRLEPGNCITFRAHVRAINTRGQAGREATSNALEVCVPDPGPEPPVIIIDTLATDTLAMVLDTLIIFAVSATGLEDTDPLRIKNGTEVEFCVLGWYNGSAEGVPFIGELDNFSSQSSDGSLIVEEVGPGTFGSHCKIWRYSLPNGGSLELLVPDREAYERALG
jgi:hypothetical protein